MTEYLFISILNLEGKAGLPLLDALRMQLADIHPASLGPLGNHMLI